MWDKLGNQEREYKFRNDDRQSTGDPQATSAISYNCDQKRFWCSATICLEQLPPTACLKNPHDLCLVDLICHFVKLLYFYQNFTTMAVVQHLTARMSEAPINQTCDLLKQNVLVQTSWMYQWWVPVTILAGYLLFCKGINPGCII